LSVPIGETFEVVLLVPGRTLSTERSSSTQNPIVFYMESKRLLLGVKNGSPMGTPEKPFWNLFF
jgi:hypothetical protein